LRKAEGSTLIVLLCVTLTVLSLLVHTNVYPVFAQSTGHAPITVDGDPSDWGSSVPKPPGHMPITVDGDPSDWTGVPPTGEEESDYDCKAAEFIWNDPADDHRKDSLPAAEENDTDLTGARMAVIEDDLYFLFNFSGDPTATGSVMPAIFIIIDPTPWDNESTSEFAFWLPAYLDTETGHVSGSPLEHDGRWSWKYIIEVWANETTTVRLWNASYVVTRISANVSSVSGATGNYTEVGIADFVSNYLAGTSQVRVWIAVFAVAPVSGGDYYEIWTSDVYDVAGQAPTYPPSPPGNPSPDNGEVWGSDNDVGNDVYPDEDHWIDRSAVIWVTWLSDPSRGDYVYDTTASGEHLYEYVIIDVADDERKDPDNYWGYDTRTLDIREVRISANNTHFMLLVRMECLVDPSWVYVVIAIGNGSDPEPPDAGSSWLPLPPETDTELWSWNYGDGRWNWTRVLVINGSQAVEVYRGDAADIWSPVAEYPAPTYLAANTVTNCFEAAIPFEETGLGDPSYFAGNAFRFWVMTFANVSSVGDLFGSNVVDIAGSYPTWGGPSSTGGYEQGDVYEVGDTENVADDDYWTAGDHFVQTSFSIVFNDNPLEPAPELPVGWVLPVSITLIISLIWMLRIRSPEQSVRRNAQARR